MSRCIGYMGEHGYQRIEADPEAEARWVERVRASSAEGLISDVPNWMNGTNIPGKARSELIFGEGFAAYLDVCAEVESRGYEGFKLQ